MITAIPVWVSLLSFLLLQGFVLLYLGLPLWRQKKAGEKLERHVQRQFRATAGTVFIVLFVLLDPVGLFRLLGIDPMLWLAGMVVWIVDFLRSL